MKPMKKILSALLLLVFPVSFVFAESAVVYQGQSVAPKGILVSSSNTQVYMGRLVTSEPPVVRGILIATPYTYESPRYTNSYSYDSDPVTDTLLTIGIVGGLVALFSLGGHGHYRGGYSHYSHRGWRHC